MQPITQLEENIRERAINKPLTEALLYEIKEFIYKEIYQHQRLIASALPEFGFSIEVKNQSLKVTPKNVYSLAILNMDYMPYNLTGGKTLETARATYFQDEEGEFFIRPKKATEPILILELLFKW